MDAPIVFTKRPRPGGAAPGARRTARNRSPSSASDAGEGNGRLRQRQEPARAGPGPKRLSLPDGGDSDEGGLDDNVFRVKKSRLSKQMSARRAPIDSPFPAAAPKPEKPRSEHTATVTMKAGGNRRFARTEDPGDAQGHDGDQVVAGSADEIIVAGDDAKIEGGDDAESDPELQASTAARLARAQRAAAREVNGATAAGRDVAASRPDYIPLVPKKPVSLASAVRDAGASAVEIGTERSSPFEPPAAAGALVASRDLQTGSEEEMDAAEAWALQQMRVGAHRRHGGVPASAEAAKLLEGASIPAPRSSAPLPRKSVNGDTGLHWAQKPAAGTNVQTPAQAMAKLWETVQKIESGVGDRTKRTEDLEEQRLNALDQLKEIEKQERGLDKSLKTVQELEGLAWSLGGLLDAKLGKLKEAQRTLGHMERDVTAKRRRRRIRCLIDELVHIGGASISKPSSEFVDKEDEHLLETLRKRRDSRRLRRTQRAAKDAFEGWDTSSASEQDGLDEWASDRAALCRAAHKQVMGDVSEEFATATAVLAPLRTAKKHLHAEYEKAFVPLSLPEMLTMHVEHSLLWWDPLQLCAPSVTSWGPRAPIPGVQLEDFDWFADLAAFTELQGDDDPDGSLVPQLVQRCVFPEVGRRLRECWDVTSARQTERVAALLDECLLFDVDEKPADGQAAQVVFADIQQITVERLEKGLEEHAPEVFVPREAMPRWYSSKARCRLLWRSCKIARCAMLLDGRLPDEQLSRLVLNDVFSTRIAPHLRSPRTDMEELRVVERYVASLPRRWLDEGLPPALSPLRDALGPRAAAGAAAAAGPDAAEAAARVLRALRCFDEAQVILDSLPTVARHSKRRG